MDDFTLIVPYHNNPLMLARHLILWSEYPAAVSLIVVDDCSAIPAKGVIEAHRDTLPRLRLYRIEDDIPWNRNGARNLGAHLTETKWMVQTDIDHTLSPLCARALLQAHVSDGLWYLFTRFRNGKADETRRKDSIPDDAVYGKIKPHGDSYLCAKALYDKVGGYDEDYSGTLGGGSPFLKQMLKRSPVHILPDEVYLEVTTRSICADASETALSRDTTEYARRRQTKEKAGNTVPRNPLRFKWSRVL